WVRREVGKTGACAQVLRLDPYGLSVGEQGCFELGPGLLDAIHGGHDISPIEVALQARTQGAVVLQVKAFLGPADHHVLRLCFCLIRRILHETEHCRAAHSEVALRIEVAAFASGAQKLGHPLGEPMEISTKDLRMQAESL